MGGLGMTADVTTSPWTRPAPQPSVAWEDEPIVREFCLAVLDEFDGEVFPARCALPWGHDDERDHKAATHGTQIGSVSGPEITWRDGSAA